jgi:hypothetical protein
MDHSEISELTPSPLQPPKFERAQVFLRLAILIVLGVAGAPFRSLLGLLYLALPIAAAIAIADRGPERFMRELAPRFTRVLRFIVSALAYLMLLTDELPGRAAPAIRLEIAPSGAPSVGSALLRLLASLPAAFGVALLGMVSGFLWLVAAVLVLIHRRYPAPIAAVQQGILRFMAELLAYHASLVGHYPALSAGHFDDVSLALR